METFFAKLQQQEAAVWNSIYTGELVRHIRAHGVSRELYIAMMTEIYHYVRHNAQNQALAAVQVGSERLELLKYSLHHAYAEAGHDQMILHDLACIGVDPEEIKATKPLPETEAFVAYLYRIATELDATARLGYSYWAENAYAYTGELVQAIQRDLELGADELTFFIEHGTIDEAHFAQVKKILASSCTTPELQEGALEVLRATLRLTGHIMDAVYRKVYGQPALPVVPATAAARAASATQAVAN